MSDVVLITGSPTGLGRYTAEVLLDAGYHVYASMLEPNGCHSEHAEALQRQGATTIALDVKDEDSIEQAVATIIEQHGRIDVLINNAGIAAGGVTEAFTTEQVAEVFDVNVLGLHRTIRAVLPHMRQRQSGLIINISSISGRINFPFFGLYNASKHAIEALSESFRYEVSQLGIDIVLVQPGPYPTDIYQNALQPSDTDRSRDYGEAGELHKTIFNHFMEKFIDQHPPDPNEVANRILDLIKTPAGERPSRTVIGDDYGAVEINNAIDPIQKLALKRLGIEHIDTIKNHKKTT